MSPGGGQGEAPLLLPAPVDILHDGVVEPRGVVEAPGPRVPPTRGVHWIVKVVRPGGPSPGPTQQTGLTGAPLTPRLIVPGPAASGAVVHVAHLGLEAVEPLPVVDSDGDGEAEHEDGGDHTHRAPGSAPLARQPGVRGQGGGGVIHPHRHRAVGTWSR